MRYKTLCTLAILGLPLIAGYACANKEKASSVQSVSKIELNQYLGSWYEIARKPMYFQKKCAKDVTANYTLGTNGNIQVTNRCLDKNGQEQVAHGEAYVVNSPKNSQLKVSFLPKALRWLPVGRGDYWIVKIDPDYQVALVGDPQKKYLWLLARTPKISQSTLNEYQEYAKSIGYDLSDLKLTVQN